MFIKRLKIEKELKKRGYDVEYDKKLERYYVMDGNIEFGYFTKQEFESKFSCIIGWTKYMYPFTIDYITRNPFILVQIIKRNYLQYDLLKSSYNSDLFKLYHIVNNLYLYKDGQIYKLVMLEKDVELKEDSKMILKSLITICNDKSNDITINSDENFYRKFEYNINLALKMIILYNRYNNNFSSTTLWKYFHDKDIEEKLSNNLYDEYTTIRLNLEKAEEKQPELEEVINIIHKTGVTKCESQDCYNCPFDKKGYEYKEFGNANICQMLCSVANYKLEKENEDKEDNDV